MPAILSIATFSGPLQRYRAQSLPQALQMPPEHLPVTPTPTPHPLPDLDPPDEIDPAHPPDISDPSLPGERAPVRDPQPTTLSHGPH